MLRQRKIRSFRCRKSKKPGFPKSNRRSERPILPKRPVMKKNKPEKSILKIWLKSPKKPCGVPMPRFLIFPGAMLRMSFKQIDDILTRRGFRRTVQKLDIPNFIRWRNEDKCRASGVVGYERFGKLRYPNGKEKRLSVCGAHHLFQV